jgi:hypothetical protein
MSDDPLAPDRRALCLNCGTALTGPYCHACGQSSQSPLIPLGTFLREGLSEILSLDGLQLRSLRALVTRPGLLTAEYLAGRRARYVHPVRLFAWLGVLSYLLARFLPAESLVFSAGPRLFGDETVPLDALFLAWTIPAGALAHWIVLRRQIPFVLAHLVLVLHLFAFTFAFAPVEAAIYWATNAVPWLGFVLVLVGPLVWFAYWLLALARILEIPPRAALVKAFLIYWAFLFMLGPVILADILIHG